MLRFLTAGESHGRGLIAILEGLPFGMRVARGKIEDDLRRRRLGIGRSDRMRQSLDDFDIVAGVKDGKTTGSPIALFISNEKLDDRSETLDRMKRGSVTVPRPGHADLAGAMKLLTSDLSAISERASARETAARVAIGSLCRIFLSNFHIEIMSHTLSVGSVSYDGNRDVPIKRIAKIPSRSALRCASRDAELKMIRQIEIAIQKGDTVGAAFQVVASGVPPGIGSYGQWDRRIDALIAQAVVSIPAVKAVEIGKGISGATSFGSRFHDEIYYARDMKRFRRRGNNAGGIEGGMTNGEEIRVNAFLKPLPSLKNPLDSVSLGTKRKQKASTIRSDICPVVAASVIAESMLSFIIAMLILEKFGGDSIGETVRNYRSFMRALRIF